MRFSNHRFFRTPCTITTVALSTQMFLDHASDYFLEWITIFANKPLPLRLHNFSVLSSTLHQLIKFNYFQTPAKCPSCQRHVQYCFTGAYLLSYKMSQIYSVTIFCTLVGADSNQHKERGYRTEITGRKRKNKKEKHQKRFRGNMPSFPS